MVPVGSHKDPQLENEFSVSISAAAVITAKAANSPHPAQSICTAQSSHLEKYSYEKQRIVLDLHHECFYRLIPQILFARDLGTRDPMTDSTMELWLAKVQAVL